jgi:ABC-type uncharacterized transport system permease subunit
MLVGDQEVTRKISLTDGTEESDTNVIPGEEQLPDIFEEPPKKRGWWIFALVIAAIALTVIFFRVYKSGFVTSAAGNQQPINAAP